MGNAQPVSPEEAQAYFESLNAQTFTQGDMNIAGGSEISSMSASSATTISDEIKELARALQYDPRLIYDYVHNHIDYVSYFGSLKGATLTYLDGSGNDFDQASLMIALLRESGNYNATIGTVQYVYGQMDIPGSDLISWLGIDDDGRILSSVLGNGGIPVGTIYVYDLINYQINYAQVNRVWVKAAINGTDYVFDPALKSYSYFSKINIGQSAGYDQANFLAAAQVGATIGSDYVRNLNEASIGAKLTEYSTNLINTIRSQYPNSDMKEIIGGRSIVQSEMGAYQPTLPFATRNIVYWDEVPNYQSTTLRIQHVGIDYTFYISQIAGQRLTITYSGNVPELRLEGNLIASGNATTLGTKYDCIMTIDHPYAGGNPPGTYIDQTHTFKIESGASYAIVSDFGGTNDILIQKRQKELDKYLADGLSSTSEKVRGETLNVMGLTWMKEVVLTERLSSALTDIISVKHHAIGLMAQEAGYYIDVPLAYLSNTSKHNIPEDRWAHFKAVTLISSALEHGILEQLMGSNNPGLSTMKIFQVANSGGQKVFRADQANFSSIQSQLQGYSSSTISQLQTDVNNGNTLMLPQNGNTGMGTWSGTGYITKKFTTNSGSIGMIISGGYHGGYVYNPIIINPPVITNTVFNQVYNSYTPVSIHNTVSTIDTPTTCHPIDMASGAEVYENVDIALGGSAPMGLSFGRSFDSGLNNTKKTLGYGWSHNQNIYLDKHSHGDPGLGSRQSIDAAALIAELYVAIDLLKSDSTGELLKWTVTSLAAKWAVDRLIDNAITVHLGGKLMEFIKLPDNTYTPPPGITTRLIDNGNSTYSLKERFGTTLDFDTSNKISKLIDADGNAMTFTYSGNNLTQVKDAFNRTLTLQYDASSRINRVTDSTGRFVSYGYTGDDLTSYTDTEGKVWSYAYTDPNNPHRITSFKNPLQITTVTDEYDSLGRVKKQTFPRQSGTPAIHNFYFSGYRNIEEDGGGNTIFYFDDKGRTVAEENALGNKSTKQYDGQNHVVRIIDPRNNRTDFYYDGDQNLITTDNALAQSTDYIYDPQFRLTDTVDPLYHGAHVDYDSEHHPIISKTGVQYDAGFSLLDNGVSETRTTYYLKGLVWNKVDGLGMVTTLTYDSYGNPSTSTTGSHPAVTTAYNSKGWMTSFTDQVSTTTTFPVYNNRGQLKKKTDPLLKDTIFEYDNAGRLSYKIDRNGQRIDYSYTLTDKVERVTYPDASAVNYTYDQYDQFITMQDSAGTTGYTYDAAGRPTSSTFTYSLNPASFAVGYEYDANGNLTKLTYPGNKTVSYTYDALNRLKTVKIDWLNQMATYYYDAAGRLYYVQNFNGTVTMYGYDKANRLTALENKKSDMSVISTYQFTLDGNGNRTQVVQNEPLTLILNPENVSYTYNTQKNRLLATNTTTFGYDFEGQLSTGYGLTYSFDYEHRLTGIGSSSQFSYDSKGNRVQTNRNGVTTRYIYDARGNLLAEADGNNNITKYYIYGAGLLAMVTPTNQVYTYHFNAVGSTVAMSDSSQNIVNKYSYDPFGKITNQVEAVAHPFKFVGQHGVMTEPNGFLFMRARYYDPEVGRFISEDPIGFEGGDTNLMAYVGNNPVNLNDPLGLYWFRQSWQTDFVVGREMTPVPPGGPISRFIEDYVPAGRTFGEMHDNFVDTATSAGIPDWLANIPSMNLVYGTAVATEVLRTIGILDQPVPPTSCK